jgi:hypothetical protein
MQAAARPVLLLPLVLLAVPFGAAAGSEDLISVEYAGTITEVLDAPTQYHVGERISGRLSIDPRMSWPRTETPGQTTYVATDPAFVSGFWNSSGDAFDRVFVGNEVLRTGTHKPVDIFSVEDVFVVQGGSLDGARTFSVDAALFDFLGSDSLDQSFELTSADVDEPEESLSGGFRFSNLGPFAFVNFVVDHLKVTPGRCSAG